MHDDPAQRLVDTFLAAFNTPSGDRMAELLAEAFTRDVTFWGPLGRTQGFMALENFVTYLRGHGRGPGRMVRTSAVDAPGEWARYAWAYRDASGAVVLDGVDMVHVRDGRIDQLVVFSGPLAARPDPDPPAAA
ncbi:nuclear transport factor 2 family protein [Polymorphospora sp. NPDC051019]|uniref:nuclear transport factor 2 family protein n=1 Tax=Polymorphospora sp. NPDC051019 TaxID=3155725 RepID=UPI00343B1816